MGQRPKDVSVTSLISGDGQTFARKGDTVAMHFEGFFMDGTKFESSRDKDPMIFIIGIGAVIPGWEDGIAAMSLGEKAKIFIPSNKAYGAQGNQANGGCIPPNADLVFEVELLKVG